jgi:diguanylate cyclase (GGDEF)-like protein
VGLGIRVFPATNTHSNSHQPDSFWGPALGLPITKLDMTRTPVAAFSDGASPESPAAFVDRARVLTVSADMAGEGLTESVKWKLVESVFNQRTILIVGGFVLPAVAGIGFCRTGHSWFIVWGAAAVLVFLGRLGLDFAFARRGVRFGRRESWQRFFLIGAWANGGLCGLAGVGAVRDAEPFTQMLVITMLTAFVMGSAARNAAFPKAAIGSVLFAEVPLLAACLATHDVYYMLYGIFIVFYFLSALSVVRHLYEQTARFLKTDEEKAELVNEIGRSNLELAAANRQLEAMASTDGLTGVPNRRSFDDSLAKEARRAQREDTDLSLLILDIDSFKGYNDRYGHQAGDDCLHRVAQALTSFMRRPGDMLARYGGEEFVVILPLTDRSGAAMFAEVVRAGIEALGDVTVSIGVASFSRDHCWRTADLIRLADEALYDAKGAGRNRVRIAPAAKSAGILPQAAAEEVALS